jgi:hypothetical protein
VLFIGFDLHSTCLYVKTVVNSIQSINLINIDLTCYYYFTGQSVKSARTQTSAGVKQFYFSPTHGTYIPINTNATTGIPLKFHHRTTTAVHSCINMLRCSFSCDLFSIFRKQEYVVVIL